MKIELCLKGLSMPDKGKGKSNSTTKGKAKAGTKQKKASDITQKKENKKK